MLNQLRAPSIFRKSHDYMPLAPLPPLARSRIDIKIAIAICIIIITTLAITISPLEPVERARGFGILKSAPLSADDPIPSIVHYVYIKKDADLVIKFPFIIFASVMYIKPTQIYIHADYNETEIRNASMKGDRWTRAVTNTFPDILRWNGVYVPNFAGSSTNQRISAIQHKSDFIRWDTIANIGGIYLDWDVVPLRPLTPLLNAGSLSLAAISTVTQSNSTMARIIVREQHAGFNGAWLSNLHSMTIIAEHLVTIPNEVLILDRNSLAPTHWFQDSIDKPFMPQPGRPSPEPVFVNTTNAMELYENVVLNRRRHADWEIDFSSTYLLHGFSMSHYHDYINPKIILSRTSTFGVATYETVKKMKADGIISGNEDGKELLGFPDELDLDEAGDLTHALHATMPPFDIPVEDILPPENKGTAS
ncbi:hypothetical protein BU25DRAFT_465519 [Macroventuria anomochaeta]|uniref:Uncharacterized protein n=1 Tax=Macroventuria anomochaeta TaxID=301207 RepID=A0ACB6S5A1_9PLEO|nr:uncharacterized protein BU25DRAFT_465519 [Macroventuria anomochaeta]KAF2629356.1 hypothetical protein BU25DRAFT_465519 [Macroventuria anomochaeta]